MTYEISADAERLDLEIIHRYLSEESYWAPGISREIVARSIANSLCFGVYDGATQVGFARLITDCATYAYLADVFILEAHRGKGLSKRLMEAIIAHPEVQGLRRWSLITRDAHTLYEQFGFKPLAAPHRYMERHAPNAYAKP